VGEDSFETTMLLVSTCFLGPHSSTNKYIHQGKMVQVCAMTL
jgi:hypothetical protein